MYIVSVSLLLMFALTSFIYVAFVEADDSPENEIAMLESWVHGFWQTVPYQGLPDGVDFAVRPMTAHEHEDLLANGVDFLLNTRISHRAASSAIFKNRRGESLPHYLYARDFRYRDHIVSQVAKVRSASEGGPISLAYTSQRFRDSDAVLKVAASIKDERASTRFLVARFVEDVRLLNNLLRTEKDEYVLTMLCIRATGYIAGRGRWHEQIRKLVIDAIPNIENPLLLRTLVMFCEQDERILRRVASADDPAAGRIAAWRLQNFR